MTKSNQELMEASIDFACDKLSSSKGGLEHRWRFYKLCHTYEHRFDTTTPKNFFELFWDKAKEE